MGSLTGIDRGINIPLSRPSHHSGHQKTPKWNYSVSYLFLCEAVTASHLADLVGLLVAAGGAVPAVVLALAAGALPAPAAQHGPVQAQG